MDIKELQKMVLKFRNDRDWEQFSSPKDSVLGMVAEVGELTEHFKWRQGEELNEYIRKHNQEIGEELCDVLFWVLQMSHDFDIDIEKQFPLKMKKNEEKYPAEKYKGKHSGR